MRRPGGRDDDVAWLGVDALILDRPTHTPRAHDDHVILWRVVHVHLLDLPGGVRDEVDLDVVEPDAFVFTLRSNKAAVVGLVADLDHSIPPSFPEA